MFLAPCSSREVASDSGAETDYPFNDEQQYQHKFWEWVQPPKTICCQACVTGGPTEQTPEADLVESQDGPLAPKALRKLALQVEACCGDLAVDDMPGTPLEFKEGSQEPVVLPDFNGYDQPTEMDKLNEEDERKETTELVAKSEVDIGSEAHLEETEAKNTSYVNGEAEQQEDMHQEGFSEFKAMLAEDIQSWWMREQQQRGLWKSPAAVSSSTAEEAPAAAADAGLGRVILEAKLSCKSEAGIEVLEQCLLQLHLFQLEKDAARCFLEEHNGLKPQVVRRYLLPLSSWLHDQVQAASSEIACNALKVEGDLEQIKCWYQSQV